jgi:hypothetical protein
LHCLAASSWVTMAVVCTGALSQWNDQSPAAIAGLFCFSTLRNQVRVSMMYRALTVIHLVTKFL